MTTTDHDDYDEEEETRLLLKDDQNHVWHPYAAMPGRLPNIVVETASGVCLKTRHHGPLIDGMSSWWAAIHGYNHPVLNKAITNQVNDMSHVMFGGLCHRPAVTLAKQLCNLTHMDHVFFSDSGSVAIEVAMKMAVQYWASQKKSKTNEKCRFLTVRQGYHGDTFHAMSVCDPVSGMHRHLFGDILPRQYFANAPTPSYHQEWDESHIKNFKNLLETNVESIAAVILEPIVQGAGGMRMYSPTYLKRVRELCTEYNVLLICDEIATGFGRTGKLFGTEHADIVPDIVCLGKALSGGYLSFAATLTNRHVAQVFSQGDSGVLMHGPTFMANPLATAVSLASLNLLLEQDWQQTIRSIECQLKTELEPCLESPLVKDVRVLGAIGVVELHEPVDMKTFQPAIVKEGVWLRPFGKLFYTMPPYIIQKEQLRKITTAMVKLTRRRL